MRAHLRRRTFRMTSLVVMVAFLATTLLSSGCFSTYYLEPDEFAKLQRPDEVPQSVSSKDGETVVVERTTNLFVRSVGGRRYSITPFNFKMSKSQIVASDRDTLLMLDEVKSYEVDLLSTGWTATLIGLGVAVAGGLIAFAVVSAE